MVHMALVHEWKRGKAAASDEPPPINLVRESPVSLSLEDEARADPVVQALLRSGANLLDVRPIERPSAGRRQRARVMSQNSAAHLLLDLRAGGEAAQVCTANHLRRCLHTR